MREEVRMEMQRRNTALRDVACLPPVAHPHAGVRVVDVREVGSGGTVLLELRGLEEGETASLNSLVALELAGLVDGTQELEELECRLKEKALVMEQTLIAQGCLPHAPGPVVSRRLSATRSRRSTRGRE